MADRETSQGSHSRLDAAVKYIAEWVRLYRIALGARNELAACTPEEVSRIAADLGISRRDLELVAAKGPGSADLLQKMLTALGVDPQSPALQEAGVMRDLQRLCVTCGHKTECAEHIADGTAAQNFYGYCPNAYTLDTIFVESVFKKV
ncbi:MAG TPA: DUF6455 family protein [Xanthobacteraceae bacterium]